MKKMYIILGSEDGPVKMSVDVDNSNFTITPGIPNSQETIMLQLIESNPSLVETDPDIKQWKEQFDTLHGSENETVADEPVADTTKKVVKKAAVADEPVADEPVADTVKKTPFAKKGAGKSYEGATVDNLPELIKGLGLNVTDPEQVLPTLLKSYETQRTNATKAGELEKQVTEYATFLAGLPPELKEVLKAHSEGKQWKDVINGADPNDYNKSFDTLNASERALAIKTLIGIDIPKEDIAKDENAKTVKLAETAYSIKQKEIKLAADSVKSSNRERVKDRDTRINQSIANLKTSLPDIDEEFVSEVEDIIKNKGIGSLFTDKNNNLLPDVAEKVLYLLYGKTLLDNSTASAAASAANKEREKVISNNISKGEGGKGKPNNVTKQEEALVETQKNITKMYKQTY